MTRPDTYDPIPLPDCQMCCDSGLMTTVGPQVLPCVCDAGDRLMKQRAEAAAAGGES